MIPAIMEIFKLGYLSENADAKIFPHKCDYKEIVRTMSLNSIAEKKDEKIVKFVNVLEDIKSLPPNELRQLIWGDSKDRWKPLENFAGLLGRRFEKIDIDAVIAKIKTNESPSIYCNDPLPSIALFFAHHLSYHGTLLVKLKKYYRLSCCNEMQRLAEEAQLIILRNGKDIDSINDEMSLIVMGFGYLIGVTSTANILSKRTLKKDAAQDVHRQFQNGRWGEHNQIKQEAIEMARTEWKNGSLYLHTKMAEFIVQQLQKKYGDKKVKRLTNRVIGDAIKDVASSYGRLSGTEGVKYDQDKRIVSE